MQGLFVKQPIRIPMKLRVLYGRPRSNCSYKRQMNFGLIWLSFGPSSKINVHIPCRKNSKLRKTFFKRRKIMMFCGSYTHCNTLLLGSMIPAIDTTLCITSSKIFIRSVRAKRRPLLPILSALKLQ